MLSSDSKTWVILSIVSLHISAFKQINNDMKTTKNIFNFILKMNVRTNWTNLSCILRQLFLIFIKLKTSCRLKKKMVYYPKNHVIWDLGPYPTIIFIMNFKEVFLFNLNNKYILHWIISEDCLEIFILSGSGNEPIGTSLLWTSLVYWNLFVLLFNHSKN